MTTHDPFAPGWLEDDLYSVVTELAARPPALQPNLTGPRAAVMTSPAWLHPTAQRTDQADTTRRRP